MRVGFTTGYVRSFPYIILFPQSSQSPVSWQALMPLFMRSSCHPEKNITTVLDFGDPAAFQQPTQLFETGGIYLLWSEYEKMKCSCLFLEKLSWSMSFG